MPQPPRDLPRQRVGMAPQMRGRYPDHDVLSQTDHWDEVTRRVVLARLSPPAATSFFSEPETATLEAFCDTVTAQDTEPRVPVLAMVAEKLAAGRGEGYRYVDMPADAETWRLVARGLDEAAAKDGAGSFSAAKGEHRRRICGAFATAGLCGGVWEELPQARAWAVVMRDVLAAFYSHPWAWNEIGFGGPAYPRGYARIGVGRREPWEGEEAFVADPVGDVPERGLE